MDAQAYLIRHGWSGPGNPLNPNKRPGPHGGLGLTKPILVARKQNNHGVGKKTTKDPTNQWWLRGFEDALKGVGDDSPAAASAKTNNALSSELYRFFVRGEGLAGTLNERKVEAPAEKSQSRSKRKRDTEEEEEEEADRKVRREEKAARKEERRKRRKVKGSGETGLISLSDSSDKREESKEERRLRRKEKKKEKESRGSDVNIAVDDAGKDLKKAKKAKRSGEEDYPTPMSTEQESELTRSRGKKDKEKKRQDKKVKKESKDPEKSASKKKSKKDKAKS